MTDLKRNFRFDLSISHAMCFSGLKYSAVCSKECFFFTVSLSAAERTVLISCRVTIERTVGSDRLWLSFLVTQAALGSRQSFSTKSCIYTQTLINEWHMSNMSTFNVIKCFRRFFVLSSCKKKYTVRFFRFYFQRIYLEFIFFFLTICPV